MTAKEKANDLVNQYRMILMDEDTDCGNEILCSLIAKKCALIACDEILYFMDSYDIDLSHKHQFDWWNKVRIEIERL